MKKNVAPWLTSPIAHTRPWWRLITRCTVARPIPVPSKFVGGMQALEGPEQLPGIRHVEAGPVVAHEVDRLPAGGDGAEFDARVLAPPGEFPGVAQQVVQHHGEQARIPEPGDALLDHHLRPASGLAGLEPGDGRPGQGADIDRRALELPLGHAGQVEQAID